MPLLGFIENKGSTQLRSVMGLWQGQILVANGYSMESGLGLPGGREGDGFRRRSALTVKELRCYGALLSAAPSASDLLHGKLH